MLRLWLKAVLGIVLLALVLAAGSACSRIEKEEEAEERKRTAENAQLVARVGGDPVTLGDFRASLDEVPPFVRQSIAGETAISRHFSDMIRFMMLVQEARARGLDSDPDVQLAVRGALVHELWASEGESVDTLDLADATLDARIAQNPDRYVQPSSVSIVTLFVRDASRARLLEAVFTISTATAGVRGDEWLEKYKLFAIRHTQEIGADSLLGPLSVKDAGVIAPSELVEAALATQERGRLHTVLVPGGAHLFALEEVTPGAPLEREKAHAWARQELLEERLLTKREEALRGFVQAADVEILDPELAKALDNIAR